MTKAERSRNLRYKRGALASMGYEEMSLELQEIQEACDEVAWYSEDMDTLTEAMDGDIEEAQEFKMCFADLAGRCEQLQRCIWDLEPQDYDDCTVALIGNRYRMMGFDSIEEDFLSLTSFEAGLAETEAGKRLMRRTKKEIIAMMGQAVGTLVAFLDLRQQYDYLKATLDILRDSNHSVLKQVKEIEVLYDKVTGTKFPDTQDEKRLDFLLSMLPERMWVE